MEIKKYIRIYLSLFRRNIMTTLSYSSFSVILELSVELGYQIAFVLMFDMIYRNINIIGGWNRYEMLFFIGLNMFVSEMLLSLIYIGSMFRLPELIRTGGLDTTLTKPIDSMFITTVGNPYVSGILSALPGFYVMWSAVRSGSLNISIVFLSVGLFSLILGAIIVYSLSIVIVSLSFRFPDSRRIPRLCSEFMLTFTGYPLNVFERTVERTLLYIFPILFMVSIPFQIIMKGDYSYLGVGLVFSVLTFIIARFVWKKSVLNYSSASS